MKTSNKIASLGIALVLLITPIMALAAEATAPQFKELPTASELFPADDFAKAGLGKLTSEEVAHLDALLLKLVNAAATITLERQKPLAAAKLNAPAYSVPSVIESQIDGEFEGWDGDTIFKLMNGQIWQQVEYSYAYSYAYMPDVLIYPSGSGYKMKVEGMDEAIEVRRLR